MGSGFNKTIIAYRQALPRTVAVTDSGFNKPIIAYRQAPD